VDRGIKDEGFVRRALDIAEGGDGRWIANQAHFNGSNECEIEPSVLAALVTSTSIYFQKGKLEEVEIENALAVKTVGEARAFIDRLSELMD